MNRDEQVACKKCGAIIDIEWRFMSDRIELKVGNTGRIRETRDAQSIECKKCSRPVRNLALEEP